MLIEKGFGLQIENSSFCNQNCEFCPHDKYRLKDCILDKDKFKNIIATYNGMLWQGVIDNRDGIKLPENLGHLLIAKCDKSKKQSENTDYAASAKYGKKVNHANWDSDNYLAKICYTNYSVKNRFSDRELWGFKAVKQFKSSVAGNFGELYNTYIHLTNNIKLGTLYKNV